MPRQVKTEGFVLKKKSLPSKDNIITLFTQDFGKINVFAKGVKTITSKRLPHLQTGNLITATVSNTSDRRYLQETVLISGFSHIKKDPHKLSFTYLLFFIIDRLLPEEQREDQEYALLKKYIFTLADEKNVPDIRYLQQTIQKLLTNLGYLDETDHEMDIEELKPVIEGLINEKLPFFII